MTTTSSAKDEIRIAAIRSVLHEHSCDALVCSLPMNVLMLSGYWPVVGTSLAIARADGTIYLIVPKDEEGLARKGWADEIKTFQPSSLDSLTTATESIVRPLQDVARSTGPVGCLAFELQETSAPASYASLHLYRGGVQQLIDNVFPECSQISAQPLLRQLRERKSPTELEGIRRACRVAGQAFERGASQLHVGMTEVEAANLFRVTLSNSLEEFPDLERADGFVFCMSGPNSAEAFGAYARSRSRRIVRGDLVLVHCNSYADGLWTDITRTYHVGNLQGNEQEMYESVFAARESALAALAPGATGAAADRAARGTLEQRGYGPNFKHSTGHGVRFECIAPMPDPPASDVGRPTAARYGLQRRARHLYRHMGGVRHCDMVALTEDGYGLLTPFHATLESLILLDR